MHVIKKLFCFFKSEPKVPLFFLYSMTVLFSDSFASMRSEDTDSELRTEPCSEPSSEPDPFHQPRACDNSYIPAFAQIFFSSPFAPQIRVSNCSCSSCSTSSVSSTLSPGSSSSQSPGAASSSSTSAPSGYSSQPSTSATQTARPADEDEDDNVSLGFSFADDHISQDGDKDEKADIEDEELLEEDLRRNGRSHVSGQVWLQPPVAESSSPRAKEHYFAPINNLSDHRCGEHVDAEGKQGYGDNNLGVCRQEQDFHLRLQASDEQQCGFVDQEQGRGEHFHGFNDQQHCFRREAGGSAPDGCVEQFKGLNPDGVIQSHENPFFPSTSQTLQREFAVNNHDFPEGMTVYLENYAVDKVPCVDHAAGFVDHGCHTMQGGGISENRGFAPEEGHFLDNGVAAQWKEFVMQDHHSASQDQDCIVLGRSFVQDQNIIQEQGDVQDERLDQDYDAQDEKRRRHARKVNHCSGSRTSLGSPVAMSSPCREAGSCLVLGGDHSTPVRRQSPCTCTQASPKFFCIESTSEYEGNGKADMPGKRSSTSPQKRRSPSSNNHALPVPESVLQGEDMNGPSNKESLGTRKSPRTPIQVSSPNALQTKRRRRHSSHAQDL